MTSIIVNHNYGHNLIQFFTGVNRIKKLQRSTAEAF
jgi:hypothetical protein